MSAANIPARSAYTSFCSSLLFPLHERLKRHDTSARLRALEESQWWPADRIEVLRVERLRAFLASAAARVPFYGELFRHSGFDPVRLRAVADLAAIPMLTKPLIRENAEMLKARGVADLARYNTGWYKLGCRWESVSASGACGGSTCRDWRTPVHSVGGISGDKPSGRACRITDSRIEAVDSVTASTRRRASMIMECVA